MEGRACESERRSRGAVRLSNRNGSCTQHGVFGQRLQGSARHGFHPHGLALGVEHLDGKSYDTTRALVGFHQIHDIAPAQIGLR